MRRSRRPFHDRPAGSGAYYWIVGPQPRVSFTSGLAAPWQKTELVDVTLKTLDLSIAGVCKDGQGVLLKVAFFIKVNRLTDDVIRVAREVGGPRSFQPDIAADLFASKFEAAVAKATAGFSYDQLSTDREELRDVILLEIMRGHDLQGYHLEDVAVQRILPRDRQTFFLGQEEFTVDSLELKKEIRLADLLSEHAFSALARRQSDGKVDDSPGADTVLAGGEHLAVVVRAAQYDTLKTAVADADL